MAAVFLWAVIVRSIVFVYILDHPVVILQPDSRIYVSLADGLRHHGSLCYAMDPGRVDVERMPGYPLLLALFSIVFGGNFLPVVVLQVILDSFSCVLIYLLAEKMFKCSGLIAGLLASLNIGMVTYSLFILNDSIFLFALLFLLVVMHKLFEDSSWKRTLLTCVALGEAAYIRPVIIYLPLFFVPFLFVHLLLAQKASVLSAFCKSFVILLLVAVSLSPWAMRNFAHYKRLKLTAQAGEHLLQYIVPFVWQYSKGIPFIEGMRLANQISAEEMNRKGIEVDQLNPFEKSDLQVGTALEILKREPFTAIARAWIFGMVKNLFAPAIIDMSYLLGIERPHFFYTEGNTLIDRGWNFIRSIKGWFGWAVIANILGLVIFRVIQVWGFVVLFRKKKWEAGMCLLIIGYFLLVSGPVGYAKYRLPFEPILIVLLAIGLKDLWNRWRLEERIASLTSGLRRKAKSV